MAEQKPAGDFKPEQKPAGDVKPPDTNHEEKLPELSGAEKEAFQTTAVATTSTEVALAEGQEGQLLTSDYVQQTGALKVQEQYAQMDVLQQKEEEKTVAKIDEAGQKLLQDFNKIDDVVKADQTWRNVSDMRTQALQGSLNIGNAGSSLIIARIQAMENLSGADLEDAMGQMDMIHENANRLKEQADDVWTTQNNSINTFAMELLKNWEDVNTQARDGLKASASDVVNALIDMHTKTISSGIENRIKIMNSVREQWRNLSDDALHLTKNKCEEQVVKAEAMKQMLIKKEEVNREQLETWRVSENAKHQVRFLKLEEERKKMENAHEVELQQIEEKKAEQARAHMGEIQKLELQMKNTKNEEEKKQLQEDLQRKISERAAAEALAKLDHQNQEIKFKQDLQLAFDKEKTEIEREEKKEEQQMELERKREERQEMLDRKKDERQAERESAQARKEQQREDEKIRREQARLDEECAREAKEQDRAALREHNAGVQTDYKMELQRYQDEYKRLQEMFRASGKHCKITKNAPKIVTDPDGRKRLINGTLSFTQS